MPLQQDIQDKAQQALDKIQPYTINIAGGFWVASSLALSSAVGFGGTPHESVGGAVIFTGEAVALTLGNKWRYAYNYTASAFISGTLIQRWPEISSDHLMALGMGALTVLNTPAVLEFCLKDKAKQKLEEFKKAGRSLVDQTTDAVKRTALWCYANPRNTTLNTNALYLLASLATTVSGAMANKEHANSLTYLVPFYLLMLVGNRFAVLSERPTGRGRGTEPNAPGR